MISDDAILYREYLIYGVGWKPTDFIFEDLNNDGSLSFSTDKFSTYALVYEDKKTVVETGDTTNIVGYTSLAIVSLALLYGIKKYALNK